MFAKRFCLLELSDCKFNSGYQSISVKCNFSASTEAFLGIWNGYKNKKYYCTINPAFDTFEVLELPLKQPFLNKKFVFFFVLVFWKR